MSLSQHHRGQTTLDFTIGISIFILTVAFVFAMVPSIVTPFAEGHASKPLLADRTADQLSESTLADSDSSAALNSTATTEFFNRPDENLSTELHLPDSTQVNVSVVTTTDGHGEPKFTRGPAYPVESGQVTVTRRIVVFEGATCWLYIRVW